MGRLFSLIMAGMLLTGAAGGWVPDAAGERAVAQTAVRPLGPSAPTSPYSVYLPIIFKKYAAGYVSPFGIDMYGDNSVANGQNQMQAAGSGWETVTFQWSSIEPAAPVAGVHTYDWSGFDGIAGRASAAGMHLFALFTGNPAWAASLAGGPVNPGNLADLVRITTAAAERYDGDGLNDAPGSPVVADWSYYAEPDNQSHWGNNPSAYADMIAVVANGVHAANPKAIVMIGGLAYDNFTPGGPFVQTFLASVLDLLNAKPGGAPAYLNALAFHFYPINIVRWPTIKDKAAEIRSILSAHGAASLPLIVPEMGYWSQTVPGHPEFDSNEPQQARRLVQMFMRGLSVGIQQMSWFAVFDGGTGIEAHGLFRGTDLNSPKPAYAAYATMTSELYGGQYVGPLSGSGIEGYIFSIGGSQETVVWATGTSANVSFHQSCVRRVDYVGNVTNISDGTPGWDQDTTAGQITLQVLKDQPIYVGGC